MATPQQEILPVGDPARPVVRAAVRASVLNAVLFTVFAYVTTQVKPVRHGSPWQDDPYDTVVTFTMFFVPIVTGLVVLRSLLCRSDEPLPLHRAAQLLRAAAVSTVLATATVVDDWAALAARADHPLWNSRTPWLVAALAVLSVSTAATWAALTRTRGLLPGGGEAEDDWLDDALPLVRLLGARLPKLGSLADRMDRRDLTGWIRRRATAVVVAGSLLAGLAVATGLAREDGLGPLFLSETLWFAGGMYAFGMVTNDVLRLTKHRPRERFGRAFHSAAVAGAAALPLSLGLRHGIMAAVGLGATRPTPASVTALTVVCAVLAGAVAFTASLVLPGNRQPGPTPPAGEVRPG